MEHTLAWILGAIAVGGFLGTAWASFRSKGRTELLNLMEQRIRFQDEEIARLTQEKQVLVDRNALLTNGFVDRIVAAVERVLGERDRDRRQGGGR